MQPIDSIAKLRNVFKKFPAEYSLAPLWFWNGDMRTAEIARQLKELKQAHVNEAMIFPIAGLDIPYLSDEYFQKCVLTVRLAKKIGMKIWFYDEYNWPSGPCGGIINEKYPQYLMKSLRYYRYLPDKARRFRIRLPAGRLLSLLARSQKTGRQVRLDCLVEDDLLLWQAPATDWEVFALVVADVQHILDTATGARWCNGLPGYLDVLNKEAVAKFIELTYEGYYRRLKPDFGMTIKGFFTDEPGMGYDTEIKGRDAVLKTRPGFYERSYQQSLAYPAEPGIFGFFWTIPWTRDLLSIFRSRYGYDLKPELLNLAAPYQERSAKLGHDYWMLISDLFHKNFCEQIGRWCGARQVAFSGHFGENLGPEMGYCIGDIFRAYRAQQVPGIDYLGPQRKYFFQLPKLAASAAKTTGAPRVLCETHAIAGWRFQLSGRIRINDQLAMMGVNLNCPIDFAYSFKGIRKDCANPPGFYQSPQWPYQRIYSDHVARVNFMASSGFSAARLAALFPVEEIISKTGRTATPDADFDSRHHAFLDNLFKSQIDCDLISDTSLPLAKIKNGRLSFPGAEYEALVLLKVERMAEKAIAILMNFVRSGGVVLFFHALPRCNPEGKKLSRDFEKYFGKKMSALLDCWEPVAAGLGNGRIVFVPDFSRQVFVSSEEPGKNKLKVFDNNPATAWAACNELVPQHIGVDFLKPQVITGCKIVWESPGIAFANELQVSNDGRTWKAVKKTNERRQEQSAGFHGLRARFFRVLVTGAEKGHWVAMTKLDVFIKDENGNEKAWRPALDKTDAGIVGHYLKKRNSIYFHDDNGICPDLFVAERTMADGNVLLAMNRQFAGIRVRAKLSSDQVMHQSCEGNDGDLLCCHSRESGNPVGNIPRFPIRSGMTSALKTEGLHQSVEIWDADSGQSTAVEIRNGEFEVAFAAKELRIFVLKRSSAGLAGASPNIIARKSRVVAELKGPWRFRAERANAQVFSRVQMADPARPDIWLDAVGSELPAQLRDCPFIMARAFFKANYLPADLSLLYEDNRLDHICLNGRPVNTKPQRKQYFDESNIILPIAGQARMGRNVLEARFLPEWFERHLADAACYNPRTVKVYFDAWLIGKFSVLKDALTRPVKKVSAQGWEKEGYPFYSGTGVYFADFELPELPESLECECGVNGGILDVKINGRSAGARAAEPYLVEIGKFARKGINHLELRVVNSIGTFFSKRRFCFDSSGNSNSNKSGLEYARIVAF